MDKEVKLEKGHTYLVTKLEYNGNSLWGLSELRCLMVTNTAYQIESYGRVDWVFKDKLSCVINEDITEYYEE